MKPTFLLQFEILGKPEPRGSKTANAIYNRSTGEYWIPRSQINDEDSDAIEEGDEGLLSMTRWIAEQKGMA